MRKIISRLLDWKPKPTSPGKCSIAPPHEVALKRAEAERRTKMVEHTPALDGVSVPDAVPVKRTPESNYRKTKEKREKKRAAVTEAGLGRLKQSDATRQKPRPEDAAADLAVDNSHATGRRRKLKRPTTLPHI